MTSTVTRAGVTTHTRYTYDGLTLLALAADATDGASHTIAYLYTADGRPYAAIYRAGETVVPFTLITTDRGDVVGLADATGAPFASYRYDQWGRPLGVTTQGTGAITPALTETIARAQVLRYAGYAYDAESGMYYCSARYYDPATMQFITKDIAKADAEESPYQYCSGDPVGKVDPSGMIAKSVSSFLFCSGVTLLSGEDGSGYAPGFVGLIGAYLWAEGTVTWTKQGTSNSAKVSLRYWTTGNWTQAPISTLAIYAYLSGPRPKAVALYESWKRNGNRGLPSDLRKRAISVRLPATSTQIARIEVVLGVTYTEGIGAVFMDSRTARLDNPLRVDLQSCHRSKGRAMSSSRSGSGQGRVLR